MAKLSIVACMQDTSLCFLRKKEKDTTNDRAQIQSEY